VAYEETKKVKEEVRDQIIKKEKQGMKKNLMEEEDKIDPQVLEINHQEMERKKVSGLKGNQVLLKKMKQNQLVLQTTQSTLGKNHQKVFLLMMKKKALDLRVRKNLKVEIADLKTLALKNTVKKELNLKIF